RLTLVRIAHQILLPRKLARHEAPLQAGRKTCTPPSTQARLLDGRNDLVLTPGLRTVGAQHGAHGLVAAALDVGMQAPVRAVETGVNLWIDMTSMKAGLQTRRLKLRKYLSRLHACPSAERRLSTS